MPSAALQKVCLALALSVVPGAAADACETAGFKGLDQGQGRLRLDRPVPGRVISGFGLRKHPILLIEGFHPGLDLAAATGDAVKAAAAGRVHDAGVRGENGNAVKIDHGDGLFTIYAHLSRIEVRAGDCVAGGHVIGRAGSTGVSAGQFLHFEVWVGGKLVDPGPALWVAQPGSE
jgi:murein DD-endopeptidase MepM/ murein hydrolase activator NlpD